MPDLRISQLTSGGLAQATDEIVIARTGGNNKITAADIAAAATRVGTLSSLAVSGNLAVDTNTLYVDATNNRVGVGTASPGYPLDVVGFGRFSSGAIGSGGLTLYGDASSASGMVLTTSGNLGLGVTSSAWSASFRALQVSGLGALWGSSTGFFMSNNTYNDGSNKYIGNGFATRYYQSTGEHVWENAASNTSGAGAACTLVQAMTLDANGNLGVGETSPAARVHLKGAGEMQRFAGNATGVTLFQAWFNSANVRRGYFGYTSNNDSRILLYNEEAGPIAIGTNNSQRVSIPAAGGFVVGTAALATSAADGFLYVPTCAGTPTGTPTTQTGTAPIVVDTTNHKLYFFSGGTWRDAGP